MPNSTFERMVNAANHGDSKEVIFQRLKDNQKLDTRDPFSERVCDVIDKPTVKRWLNIEMDRKVLEVLVQDGA